MSEIFSKPAGRHGAEMSRKGAADKRAHGKNNKLQTVTADDLYSASAFNSVNKLSRYKRNETFNNNFARDKERT